MIDAQFRIGDVWSDGMDGFSLNDWYGWQSVQISKNVKNAVTTDELLKALKECGFVNNDNITGEISYFDWYGENMEILFFEYWPMELIEFCEQFDDIENAEFDEWPCLPEMIEIKFPVK